MRRILAALLSLALMPALAAAKCAEPEPGSSGKAKPGVGVAPTYGRPSPNPDHGAPDRRKQPQPVQDPSALAKVGNDKKSGVLHVDWTGATAYRITYSDGHGRQTLPPIEPLPDRYGSNIPGNRVDIPFVVTDPVNVFIWGEPVVERNARVSSCFIKWDGREVDVDFKDFEARDHSVRCDAPVWP